MPDDRTGRRGRLRALGVVELGAALWGFAEATLFFIVPDVWLSACAVRAPKRALIACVFAVTGALAGGAVMYVWGGQDPGGALAMVERVPAVSPEMVDEVDTAIESRGALALFDGPANGTPYKAYAVTAGVRDTGLLVFLLVSIPARLIRFVLITALVALVCRVSRRWLKPHHQLMLAFVGWAGFYVLFFAAMAN